MKLDVLELLDEPRLLEYVDVCRKNYPKSIRALSYLLVQIEWLKKRNDPEFASKFVSNKCLIKIYAPRGADINNCTFISISQPEQKNLVFIYTLQESLEELKNALVETRMIDWDLLPIISSTETHHLPALYEKFKISNIEPGLRIKNVMMMLRKEEAMKFEIEIPSGVYVKQLTTEDSKKVNDEWPHHFEGSDKLVQTMVDVNGGFGVYANDTNELLSWVLINDNYAPGLLQTTDSAKRKGYGALVMKCISKHLAEKHDLDTLVFILEINGASIDLFKKLGFEQVGTVSWMIMGMTVHPFYGALTG